MVWVDPIALKLYPPTMTTPHFRTDSGHGTSASLFCKCKETSPSCLVIPLATASLVSTRVAIDGLPPQRTREDPSLPVRHHQGWRRNHKHELRMDAQISVWKCDERLLRTSQAVRAMWWGTVPSSIHFTHQQDEVGFALQAARGVQFLILVCGGKFVSSGLWAIGAGTVISC